MEKSGIAAFQVTFAKIVIFIKLSRSQRID